MKDGNGNKPWQKSLAAANARRLAIVAERRANGYERGVPMRLSLTERAFGAIGGMNLKERRDLISEAVRRAMRGRTGR